MQTAHYSLNENVTVASPRVPTYSVLGSAPPCGFPVSLDLLWRA